MFMTFPFPSNPNLFRISIAPALIRAAFMRSGLWTARRCTWLPARTTFSRTTPKTIRSTASSTSPTRPSRKRPDAGGTRVHAWVTPRRRRLVCQRSLTPAFGRTTPMCFPSAPTALMWATSTAAPSCSTSPSLQTSRWCRTGTIRHRSTVSRTPCCRCLSAVSGWSATSVCRTTARTGPSWSGWSTPAQTPTLCPSPPFLRRRMTRLPNAAAVLAHTTCTRTCRCPSLFSQTH